MCVYRGEEGGGSTRRLVGDIRPPRWCVFLWTGGAGPLIKWAGLELRKVAVCARLKKSLHLHTCESRAAQMSRTSWPATHLLNIECLER